MRRAISGLSAVLILALLAGCGSGIRPPPTGIGAPAPAAAVERFLQLAGESEYLQMGWYFGTTSGPVNQRDNPSDVEKRMYALANVLQNQGFVVGTGTGVPGRVGAAQLFSVQLMRNGRQHRVPFTVVRGPGERWLVENVDVTAVTNVP